MDAAISKVLTIPKIFLKDFPEILSVATLSVLSVLSV